MHCCPTSELTQTDLSQSNQDDSTLYRSSLWQFIVAMVIGILLAIAGYSGWLPKIADQAYSYWVWGIITVIVFVTMWYSGRHFFTAAWHSFLAHTANMNTLIAIGTGAAFLYSFLVIVFPNFFPDIARDAYF